MSDEIKLNPISGNNRYQKVDPKQPGVDQQPNSSQATRVEISNKLGKAIEQISNEPAPAEDAQRLAAIKQAYQEGTYKIDYEQLTDNLVSEYVKEDNNDATND